MELKERGENSDYKHMTHKNRQRVTNMIMTHKLQDGSVRSRVLQRAFVSRAGYETSVKDLLMNR